MYTVTRQLQWPDGIHMVEVSCGDHNYTNPDALSAQYSGEFEEFTDARDAVEVAIEIARAWRKDSRKQVSLGYGSTGGSTMPFESSTVKAARAWARKAFEAAPKCAGCNGIMPDNNREYWRANDWDGLEYCSEYCADREAEFEAEQQAQFEAEQKSVTQDETSN